MSEPADAPPVPVLTIDGPTASGKGTIAARVARTLGFHYLDSGALYRLVALQSQRRGIDLDDEQALALVARDLRPLFMDDRVWLDGAEVTEAIRHESVGIGASRIAAVPAVRRALVAAQRACRVAPGLVADGRDMGTVIFPDAGIKVFLTAAVESRAERRHKQLIEKGFSTNMDALLQVLKERDARDTNRPVAPLKPAEGAVVIDSTGLDIDQTVERVLQAWRSRSGS